MRQTRRVPLTREQLLALRKGQVVHSPDCQFKLTVIAVTNWRETLVWVHEFGARKSTRESRTPESLRSYHLATAECSRSSRVSSSNRPRRFQGLVTGRQVGRRR